MCYWYDAFYPNDVIIHLIIYKYQQQQTNNFNSLAIFK